MANYEPEIITRLTNAYRRLQDLGVNAWYGDAGGDTDLAKKIIDGASMRDLIDYCREYGYIDEEEDI